MEHSIISAERSVRIAKGFIPDPLDRDSENDDLVVTTRRGITRVALVATEVGGRFQRDRVAYDPMAWMLAPRRLFGGGAAIDACLDRDHCLRGVLLHGLSLGLDADADEIDALVADDDDDFGEGPPDGNLNGPVHDVAPTPARSVRRSRGLPKPEALRLFTATIVTVEGQATRHAFHASLAGASEEVARRIDARFGAASPDTSIVERFDPSHPMVEALVSPAIQDALMFAASDPASPLAAGLELNIEQRFGG